MPAARAGAVFHGNDESTSARSSIKPIPLEKFRRCMFITSSLTFIFEKTEH
jgi:hypothetical protein